MKYKCISVQTDELWLTVGKAYEADICVSPREYSGGNWLEIKRADDGYKAYAKLNQFIAEKNREDDILGV